MAKKKETPTTTPALSAKERLAKKATTVAPVAKGTTAKRETVLVEDEAIAKAIERLTAAIHARKAVEGHEAAAKAIVLRFTKKKVFEDWATEGRKTDNPKFTTPVGSSFILQCKDTLSSGARGFRVPKDPAGKPIPVEVHLRNNGVPEDLIDLLKNKQEFKEEEVLSVNMSKLEKEHPSIASRLLDLILAANEGGVTAKDGTKISFSDDEIGKILERNNDVTIKEKFLERVVSHVKETSKNDADAADRLEKLLTAIPPQWAVGQAFCADPDVAVVKLLHENPEKDAEPKTHTTPDNKYTIREVGTLLTIIRNSDNKEIAKKTCTDAMHTGNTVKKWQRDPGSLAAFIAENV